MRYCGWTSNAETRLTCTGAEAKPCMKLVPNLVHQQPRRVAWALALLQCSEIRISSFLWAFASYWCRNWCSLNAEGGVKYLNRAFFEIRLITFDLDYKW